MKKTLFACLVASTLMIVSCTNGTKKEVTTTDSTAVCTDSTSCHVDSTKVDTAKVEIVK